MPSTVRVSTCSPRRAHAALIFALVSVLAIAFALSFHAGFAEAQSKERVERLQERAERLVQREQQQRLQPYGSQAAFDSSMKRLAKAQQLRQQAQRLRDRGQRRARRSGSGAAPAAASSAGVLGVAKGEASAVAAAGDGSITNNQVAGVDEGGIVKVHGEHLVVLRRGRLFTARVGDDSLAPVSMADAYPKGAPGGWYDEMLVHGDTIVVIGFNYDVGATELGLFDIDAAGALKRRGTHYLRSNDYYSSRNYASRLIGDQLVLYMPYGLTGPAWWRGQQDAVLATALPAQRSHGASRRWDEVIEARDIYRPIQQTSYPTLHTVVRCDLSRPGLRCTAQGIVGPASRSFYVSRDAVYVWVGAEYNAKMTAKGPQSAVYRMPFDGSAPSAVRVSGMPVDQFSFDERGGHLNVMVRSSGGGDWMWAAEAGGSAALALARLPLALFSDSVGVATERAYQRLPEAGRGSLQNRFVGDHLLYGAAPYGSYRAGASKGNRLIVHAVEDGVSHVLELPHRVERLDQMAADGVVIGSGPGGLHISALALESTPRVAGRYLQKGASQGETRSHGFFYRPTSATGGMLGLPVVDAGSGGRWGHLRRGSAGILFLALENREFTPMGVLKSKPDKVEDRCKASCVDWYGNARPIFLRDRIIALLGYELVEGQRQGARVRAQRRAHLFRDQPRR